MTAQNCMYVVFPGGRKPTPAQLQSLALFSARFADGVAIGYDIDTRRPAIRFDRETFLRLREQDVSFETLIADWERRGCPVYGKLHFMEDATRLQESEESQAEPVPEPLRKRRADPVRRSDEADLVVSRQPLVESVEHKHARAQQSQAISRLNTFEHVLKTEAIGNFARWVPGLLALGVFILIVTAGALLYNKVANSKLEPRRETIEQMVNEREGVRGEGRGNDRKGVRGEGRGIREVHTKKNDSN